MRERNGVWKFTAPRRRLHETSARKEPEVSDLKTVARAVGSAPAGVGRGLRARRGGQRMRNRFISRAPAVITVESVRASIPGGPPRPM
ncbi:hypothetical protein GCM10023224_21740 [Streptomonospora halophila]|uniref:Uncharacterized protein n=1 Tax=Streptomonospora halophila TaxID=427369 RepID=A0ABP9GEF6_9ACTN